MVLLTKVLVFLWIVASQGCVPHIRESLNLHERSLQTGKEVQRPAEIDTLIEKDYALESEHTHEISPGTIVYRTPDTLSPEGFVLKRKISVRVVETKESTQLSKVIRNKVAAYVFSRNLKPLTIRSQEELDRVRVLLQQEQ